MKRPGKAKLSIEQIADLVCEFTRDGERKTGRDILQWYRWMERRYGIAPSLIQKRRIRIAVVRFHGQ